MSRGRVAGHRKRVFRIRNSQLPDAVHMVMEFVHDICLELGVCTQCRLKLLHRKGNKVFSKCTDCLEYDRVYHVRNSKKGERP